jgi:hypothetical protein
LTGAHGARIAARKVVVTAPLKVLQSGRIHFQPPLPPAKQAAIQRLRMGNAVKVSCTGWDTGRQPAAECTALLHVRVHTFI